MMKIFSSFLVWMTGVLILATIPGSAWAERRVALVIGNAGYLKINKLENPLNDAPDVAEALRKVGFDVILRTNTDKGGFDRALSEFARKANGADAAMFYYAGHGIQYKNQNYLLPIDVEVEDYNDVEFQAVSVARVLSALERSNGIKIVVLDACRDNPLDKRISAASRGVGEKTRGLARLDRTDGLVIAYATAPDQTAQDGAGRNSPFTAALVRRLAEPGLEIAMLFRRVAQDVYEKTNGAQRPEVSLSLLNDYYLNLDDSDSLAWNRIRDSSEPADFTGFIQKYPASPLVREARFRLDLFARLRRENDERVAREQEKIAAGQDRLQREALEQERQRLTEQRKEIARLEAAARQREADRLEAARAEALRQQAEKDRLETQALETARLEAERLARQRRLGEEQIAARRDADRIAAEQAETRRRAEADRAEVLRLAALRRQETEKRQADLAKREAARPESPALDAGREEIDRLAALVRDRARRQAAASLDPPPDTVAAGSPGRSLETESEAAARRERDAAAAEQDELKRLLEARKLAAGREAERLDAVIRDLDRRQVERLAAQRRREAARLREAARTDELLKDAGGPLGQVVAPDATRAR